MVAFRCDEMISVGGVRGQRDLQHAAGTAAPQLDSHAAARLALRHLLRRVDGDVRLDERDVSCAAHRPSDRAHDAGRRAAVEAEGRADRCDPVSRARCRGVADRGHRHCIGFDLEEADVGSSDAQRADV
jgi:hypothetical protein